MIVLLFAYETSGPVVVVHFVVVCVPLVSSRLLIKRFQVAAVVLVVSIIINNNK